MKVKKIHTPEEIAELRSHASDSERTHGTDYLVKMYAKARRWEREAEREQERLKK